MAATDPLSREAWIAAAIEGSTSTSYADWLTVQVEMLRASGEREAIVNHFRRGTISTWQPYVYLRDDGIIVNIDWSDSYQDTIHDDGFGEFEWAAPEVGELHGKQLDEILCAGQPFGTVSEADRLRNLAAYIDAHPLFGEGPDV